MGSTGSGGFWGGKSDFLVCSAGLEGGDVIDLALVGAW